MVLKNFNLKDALNYQLMYKYLNQIPTERNENRAQLIIYS